MPENANFRKLLLNKCRSEFEISEPLDEEKDKIFKTVSYNLHSKLRILYSVILIKNIIIIWIHLHLIV